jgi:hypothetical protein
MPNTVVTKGTAFLYGISGSVTSLTVQSYTVSTSFAKTDEAMDANGQVVGVRMSDKRQNLSIEGLVPSAYSGAIGDNLSFTGNTIAFAGHITNIEERGTNNGFMRVSITAIDYEAF